VSQFILPGGPYRHIIIARRKKDTSTKQRLPISTYIIRGNCSPRPCPCFKLELVRIGSVTSSLDTQLNFSRQKHLRSQTTTKNHPEPSDSPRKASNTRFFRPLPNITIPQSFLYPPRFSLCVQIGLGTHRYTGRKSEDNLVFWFVNRPKRSILDPTDIIYC
jgi:hypothetical protein